MKVLAELMEMIAIMIVVMCVIATIGFPIIMVLAP